jgi:hypothetical protein
MNEQSPTESIVSQPADAFTHGLDGYVQSTQPADGFASTEHLAEFSSLSTPEPSQYLPNDLQDLAHRELPPLAQPLASTTPGLGSFAASDSWDERGTEDIGTLSAPISTPASPLPLQSFAAPETIDTAQRLSAPFSLPSLPSVAFPSLSALGTTPSFSTAPALSTDFTEPTGFAEPTGFPTSALPGSPFPSAPAFPTAPLTFGSGLGTNLEGSGLGTNLGEPPAFPVAPSFPLAPAFPASFAPDQAVGPQSFAAPEPFDAGDSFGPLSEIDTYPNPQPSFQAPDLQAAGDPFAGQVDFSSNPLPRPEALVLKQTEEPAKTSRFGRKKAAPTDLLAMGAAPAAGAIAESVADAADSGAKKAKRFGKKPAKTVDLLGAPLGARPIEAPDVSPGLSATTPLATNSMTAASLPSVGLPVDGTADDKPKRKLFARVDRSKEKPLTPNNGRSRKMVQGLAALSLLAGAGLFTMSLLDKKSPTPIPSAPPVETSVAPAVVDPTVSSTPAPTDPATGLPLPVGAAQAPVDPNAAQPPLGSGTVDTIADIATADASNAAPVPSDTTPTQDGGVPVTTIAPGPDDLEFSTGGNFSE